jgi:signal transduction histidine kinase
MPNITENVISNLKEDRKSLDDQRIATLNILEDITESQEELKYKYKHTQVLRNLLQKLTTTIDPKEVMENMLSSFEELLTFDVITFVIGEYKSQQAASTVYIYAKTLIGRSYMESSRRAFLDYFETVQQSTKNVEKLKVQLRGRMYFEFIKGSVSHEEELGRMPVSGFVVPLLLKEEDHKTLLGAFYISSASSKTAYTEDQIEIANDIASVVSFNFERINTMVRSEYSRVSNLVDSMTNGVVVFNKAYIVTLANPVIEKMTGLPCSSSSSSSSSSSLFPLEEFTKLFPDVNLNEMTRRVLGTGSAIRVEETKLFRFYYEMFITPIRDYDNKVTGGAIILHDITHTKEIDRMKTEFVSIASHQLRTPLTAINWYVESLMDSKSGTLTAKQKESLDEVYRGSKRMAKLVDDLLNVSRLETGRLKIEPKEVELISFIDSIVHELEPWADEHQVKIEHHHPNSKKIMIKIDETLMRQAIHNILTNAVRYSPDNGTVKLEIDESDQEGYTICVKDSGIGIPKSVQDRIYEKFFRADNARSMIGEGSGLGLYLTKMIVETSGGKIWFNSIEGKGTTFCLWIPKSGMIQKEGEKGLAG